MNTNKLLRIYVLLRYCVDAHKLLLSAESWLLELAVSIMKPASMKAVNIIHSFIKWLLIFGKKLAESG